MLRNVFNGLTRKVASLSASKRLYSARAKDANEKLLRSLEKYLRYSPKKHQENAEHFIHYRLQEPRLQTFDRGTIMQNVISLLVHHRRFAEAHTVYLRLHNEGFVSSYFTDAQMLVLSLSASPESAPQTLEFLDIIFSEKDKFSEQDFIVLLGMYKDLNFSPALMVNAIGRFIACRGKEYVPHTRIVSVFAGMLMKEGRAREAFEVVERYDATRAEDDTSRLHPFNSIISSLDSFDPLSLDSIDTVLETIAKNKIQSDNSIVNSLISFQTRKRSIEKAFELYTALVDAAQDNSSFAPDFFTYRSLFQLLIRHRRWSFRPSDSFVLPPRILFRHMLEHHFSIHRATLSMADVEHDRILLNSALLAFIVREDYPAAYVTIRAFSEFKVPVNLSTYNIMLTHLFHRVHRDILAAQKSGVSMWAHRVMDVPASNLSLLSSFVWRGPGTLRQKKIIQRVLDISRYAGTLPNTKARKPNTPFFGVPTYAMYAKEAPVRLPLYGGFQARPLERMVKRAFLAMLHGTEGMAVEDESLNERVTGAIRMAQEQMIPMGIEFRESRPGPESRRLRRRVWWE